MYGGEEVFALRALRMDVRRDWSGGGKVLEGGEMPRTESLGSLGVVVGD